MEELNAKLIRTLENSFIGGGDVTGRGADAEIGIPLKDAHSQN
jgi:hypothetical protein